MKTTLLTTVGLLALLTGASAQAAEAPRGYLGGAYGGASLDAGPLGDEDAGFWNVQGLVALPLGPGISGEISVEAGQLDGADTIWSPTGRLFFEVGGSRVGGFVGATVAEDFDLAGGGIEGRFELAPDWRLDGAVGYGSGDADAWTARGQLRLFLADNTRLDGFVGFTSFDSDPGAFDGWTAGLGAEHQFEGAPLSIFGRYEHGDAGDLDLSSDTIRVGLRWNFGGGTLRDRYIDGQDSATFADIFGGDLLRAASSLEAPEPPPPPPDDDDCGGDQLPSCGGIPDQLGD